MILNSAPKITTAAPIHDARCKNLLNPFTFPNLLIAVFSCVSCYLFVLCVLCVLLNIIAFSAAKICHYVTETKVTFSGILVFVSTGTGLKIVSYILPASAADNFTL